MEGLLRGARRILANLKPIRVPDSPARAFRDLWPGDAARGARLLRGEFEVMGTVRPLRPAEADGAQDWAAGSPAWRAAAHGFAWLRDLRALGTDAARLRGRALTADWLALREDPLTEAPEVAGARISAWLGHWDFLAATAEDAFRKQMMQRMAQDARNVVASLPAEAAHRGALVALKGGMAAAVALEEETWLARCVRFLPQELERQFNPDGGHVERSPSQLLAAIQDLIEIRNLLHGAGVDTPTLLPVVLDRAAPALRLMRHADGGLALFNGTREEPAAMLDLVLTQAQSRGRAPAALPDSGFHRLAASRTLVLVDCGSPPAGRREAAPGGLPRGADRFAHAGTLSFEMSVGRDRLIVNCGAAPAAEGEWRDALRATAAHSTLVLADTNSSELRPEGLGRRVDAVEADRQESNGAQWLEAAHDGWVKQFGLRHRRRLYLSESGDDLRGEDVLEPEREVQVPGFAVRFHLHPAVVASLQQDEAGVLLRLPSGVGWRLRAKGARVAIEESISLAAEARRSQQVALHTEAGTGSIQWAISRVSMPAPASGEPAEEK
ncbi:heparinase II/III family protein [Roseomonas sp. AR75]|uniref:heparinase II/III family protein n=1 Tax=Roseomonas sp. AR75 TaxID=2562311 RepID=UPI0014853588|nr:heparinase II/III family protein [Roseomonas sp. AR75]